MEDLSFLIQLQLQQLALQLVPLAEQLAVAAGEQPTRPLTRPQIERALHVTSAEASSLAALLMQSMRPPG